MTRSCIFLASCASCALLLGCFPYLAHLLVRGRRLAFQLDWDDQVNFLGNPLLARTESFVQRGLWTLDERGIFLGVWEPVALLFKMTISWLSSTQELAPLPFAMASVALHGINTAMLVLVTATFLSLPLSQPLLSSRPRSSPPSTTTLSQRRNKTRDCKMWGAVAGAVSWAVHPMRTETVLWASCQSYLLASFFTLLMLLAYALSLSSHPRRDRSCYFGADRCGEPKDASHGRAGGASRNRTGATQRSTTGLREHWLFFSASSQAVSPCRSSFL